jgi:SAM-dependent methyltransferase
LQRGYDVCGVEVSESALAVTRARLQSQNLQADLRLAVPESIPFEDASFEAVLAWHVLYYNDWRSLARAVTEINRVLRPGGAFLGTMAASGDASHTGAIPLGDGVFQSQAAGQAGATVLILEEKDLARCFPCQSLTIGHLSWEFDGAHNRSWIVSYRKGADSK